MSEAENREHPAGVTHEQAALLISRAWDGELTCEEERQLEEHLRRCSQCAEHAARFYSFLRRMQRALERHEDSGRLP